MRDMQPESDPTRRRWRLALAALFGIFVLQTIFIEKFTEPYPALTMPPFRLGTNLDDEPKIVIPEVTVKFNDGESIDMTQHEFLAGTLRAHRGPIMKHCFKKMPVGEQPRRKTLHRIFKGYRAPTFEMYEDWWKRSIEDWLNHQRLKWRLDSTATVTSVRVEWVGHVRKEGNLRRLIDEEHPVWEMSFGDGQ